MSISAQRILLSMATRTQLLAPRWSAAERHGRAQPRLIGGGTPPCSTTLSTTNGPNCKRFDVQSVAWGAARAVLQGNRGQHGNTARYSPLNSYTMPEGMGRWTYTSTLQTYIEIP